MKAQYTVDRDRVSDLYGQLGIDGDADVIFDGDDGRLEHLVHEVGHALDLGCRKIDGQWLSGWIASTFDDMLTKAESDHREARVLAATLRLCPLLGLTFDLGDFEWTAAGQGLPAGLVESAVEIPETKDLARRMRAWLIRRGVLRRAV